MPNRIIKESICTSDDIAALSWFEEVVFTRLIVQCDDYGRFDARPAMLRSVLFPLLDDDRVTKEQVATAISVLAERGMLMLYEAEGRPYLQMINWGKHQRIRDSKLKYPAPSDDSPQLAATCRDLPQSAASDGNVPLVRAQNPNPNPNPYPNPKDTAPAAAPAPARVADPEPEPGQEPEGSTTDSPALAEIVKVYTAEIRTPNSPFERELLDEWAEESTVPAVVYAIREAVKNSARSVGYVDKIVRRLIEAGVRTQEDVDAYVRDWEDRKNGARASPATARGQPPPADEFREAAQRLNQKIAEGKWPL